MPLHEVNEVGDVIRIAGQVKKLDPCCRLYLQWLRNPDGMTWEQYKEANGMENCPSNQALYEHCKTLKDQV